MIVPKENTVTTPAAVASPPAVATSRSPRRFGVRRFGADLAYVLAGFPLALASFVVLITLFTLSVSTLIIWIGLLLLPLTLFVASGFAAISRARLRAWGRPIASPHYRPRGPGITGLWRWVADGRRWLDLAFESLIAFPLRTATFSIAVTWLAAALGCLSWWAWGFYLPRREGNSLWLIEVIENLGGGGTELTRSFAFESVVYLVVGLVLAAGAPFVLRALALFDAAVSTGALGGVARGSGADAATHDSHALRRGLPTGTHWAAIAAGFVAAAAIAIGWPVLAAAHEVPVALAMTVIVVQAAALFIVVWSPVAGIAVASVAAAGAVAVGTLGSNVPPWPVTMLIVQAVFVVLVALRLSWRWAIAAWALPQAAVVLIALVIGGGQLTGASIANLIVSASVSALVGAIAILVRLWRGSQVALVAERSVSAELDDERRMLAERNRIAQELHDVVAHSMSVISVQAATAQYRHEGLDPRSVEEFDSIAGASRQALTEMRGLLATLRLGESEPGHGAPALAPQPGLDDLEALIDATARSGSSITLERAPDLGDLSPTKALTVFRVVQEALSNAVRHAPGAPVTVRLRAVDDEVEIDVTNAAPPASFDVAAAPGAGLGLTGISDRVRALGGTVSAGSRADGGFQVLARMPRR